LARKTWTTGPWRATPNLIEAFLKQGCQHLTGMGTFGRTSWARDALEWIAAAE
jgi:hypothetical protein